MVVASSDLSDRPVLAPGVELAGRFEGSAFRDPQWLIQRDGHYVQVSELVYRVAEYADGQRTLRQIADRLTESSEWTVTPEHVGRILTSKLVPLAIVAGSGQPAPYRPAASLLLPKMRKKVLGPEAIEPLAGALQFLFAPAILIPLTIVGVLAQAWLFLLHGLAAPVRDVAYTPGALGIVVLLIIAAGAFHEMGHAAALRYGGGTARSIGVGIYIIFPAFYTDTTDSYRLGRAARVRTDLGGFYFHVVFALAIIALSLASGYEWLLVAVLGIDVDIARQLFPFVRFDSYWVLTDLLGVPDMLTYMTSSMKSVVLRLLRLRPRTAREPRLKPWARPVFLAYSLVTAPILAVLLVVVLLRGPLIVSGLLTAIQFTEQAFVQAQLAQAAGPAIAAAGQLIILAVQVVGIVYVLSRVVSRAAKVLWRLGRRVTGRRVGGVVFGMVPVGLLAFYWISQLGLASDGAPVGVQTYPASPRTHVVGTVSYPQTPPVGGRHAYAWQNCGFYNTPVPNEQAVHSMEHGAVWITYQPDLPTGDVAALRVLAQRMSYVIVSPFPGLPAPVIASAWDRQLRVASAADPRLDQFARIFRLGKQAPERGGPCAGGLGTPER